MVENSIVMVGYDMGQQLPRFGKTFVNQGILLVKYLWNSNFTIINCLLYDGELEISQKFYQ